MTEYPTKKYCSYCNKWIECKNHHHFAGHRTTCKYHPQREEINKQSSIIHTHPRKYYTIICKKCNKEFKLFLSENQFKNKKYRKHCSYKCANSRPQTPEMNESRRKKLTKAKIFVKCIICGKQFKRERYRRKKTCSYKCNCKHISNKQKESYKNGRELTHCRVKWLPYKDIKVQGKYELRTCKILDNWKSQGKIKDWEYTNDRFPYIGLDNEEHTYIVDFKVFNHDDTSYYLEIKGFKRENDKLKWDAVRNLGYILNVWYLSNIECEEHRLLDMS